MTTLPSAVLPKGMMTITALWMRKHILSTSNLQEEVEISYSRLQSTPRTPTTHIHKCGEVICKSTRIQGLS